MLPDSWVESIFARLAVRYGATWLRLWEGIDMAAVKADWAESLAGMSGESIKHALACLPTDRPPTVGQFKALCLGCPVDPTPRLPAPLAKRESIDRAKEIGIKVGAVDPKRWAHLLRAREQAGDRLTQFQRDAWREALRHECEEMQTA